MRLDRKQRKLIAEQQGQLHSPKSKSAFTPHQRESPKITSMSATIYESAKRKNQIIRIICKHRKGIVW